MSGGYGTLGHVCPATGRRAITLEAFAALPMCTPGYRYMPEGPGRWLLVVGVGQPRPDGSRPVSFSTGVQLYVPRSLEYYLYVAI